MQFSSELPGDSLHTEYPPQSIPKIGAIVKLFLNRQVVEEQFHLFAPTRKVVHVLVELVEKALRPNIYVARTVKDGDSIPGKHPECAA